MSTSLPMAEPPAWRDLVEHAGRSISTDRCRPLSEYGRWHEVPTFSKRDLGSGDLFPLSSRSAQPWKRVAATSGTTGSRLFVAYGVSEWSVLERWTGQVAGAACMRDDDVLLNSHGYGLWIGGVALDTLAAAAGACVVPLGPSSPPVAFDLLEKGVGTAIAATPSYLRRLVEVAESDDVDLRATGLRMLFCGGEPAEQSLRTAVLERMPPECAWVELYGLTETCGPTVAFGIDGSELQVNTADFFLEVLGFDHDEPVPLGEPGEVVITTCALGGVSPLVRYRTGDVAVAVEASALGVVRMSTIVGRRDDALKVRGVLVYPGAVGEIVTRHTDVLSDWRLVVTSRHGEHDELVVEVEADGDTCSAISQELTAQLALRVRVRTVHDLPRSAGKTARVVREVAT